jgi:hypothetical protein
LLCNFNAQSYVYSAEISLSTLLIKIKFQNLKFFIVIDRYNLIKTVKIKISLLFNNLKIIHVIKALEKRVGVVVIRITIKIISKQ